MKTIALRFAENFAPVGGTIKAHQELIDSYGYVWYGKMGTAIGDDKAKAALSADDPKILLIQSGKMGRYWAYIEDIQRECPNPDAIPSYYRDQRDKFKTWIKITGFEKAPSNIMSLCKVVSSGAELGHASHYSMSPYFFVEVPDDL